MFIIISTNLWGMEQIHSYVIINMVIISSGSWFTSELLDICFLYSLGVPVLHLPPGLPSTCNNHIAADNYSPSRYGCYLFFHKIPH